MTHYTAPDGTPRDRAASQQAAAALTLSSGCSVWSATRVGLPRENPRPRMLMHGCTSGLASAALGGSAVVPDQGRWSGAPCLAAGLRRCGRSSRSRACETTARFSRQSSHADMVQCGIVRTPSPSAAGRGSHVDAAAARPGFRFHAPRRRCRGRDRRHRLVDQGSPRRIPQVVAPWRVHRLRRVAVPALYRELALSPAAGLRAISAGSPSLDHVAIFLLIAGTSIPRCVWCRCGDRGGGRCSVSCGGWRLLGCSWRSSRSTRRAGCRSGCILV